MMQKCFLNYVIVYCKCNMKIHPCLYLEGHLGPLNRVLNLVEHLMRPFVVAFYSGSGLRCACMRRDFGGGLLFGPISRDPRGVLLFGMGSGHLLGGPRHTNNFNIFRP